MKNQADIDANIVRSGTRIRESVRSLPKGHFQQIRDMFDRPKSSRKQLSTIHERPKRSLPPDVLLRLPVTDDEKLKHTTPTTTTSMNSIKGDNAKSLEERYRDYLAEYQTFRLKLTNEFLEHKTIHPSNQDESLFEQSILLPQENHSDQETHLYTPSLSQQPRLSKFKQSTLTTSHLNKHHPLTMSATINYADSYDSSTSNHLKRVGSTRQYVSSLQRPSDVHISPALVTTSSSLKENPPSISNETYDILQPSRRVYSSASLSSTGYDSNSSPSIKSNRNSIATNNSNDLIVHSTCSSSSSSSSSSSDEQQLPSQPLSSPWISYQSNTINPSYLTSSYNDDTFESSNEPSPLISRTQIQLHQPIIENRSINTIRHATARHSGIINSPSVLSTSIDQPVPSPLAINNSSYLVQTTSFPDNTDEKLNRKIRRWNNIYGERVELVNRPSRTTKYPLKVTESTGFQLMNANDEEQQLIQTTISKLNLDHKPIYEQEGNPLPEVETPIVTHLPPKKPPRTFEHEKPRNSIKQTNDRKLPSSSSSTENSPLLDHGTRSVSCMDLTASVTNTIVSNNIPLSKPESIRTSRRSNTVAIKANTHEPLKPTLSTIIKKENTEQCLYNSSPVALNNAAISLTPNAKTKVDHATTNKKTAMKKGVSEPNLAKRSRSKSPFSPRVLLDRVKRMLPMSLSKQSLNEKLPNQNDLIPTNDSDDSASTSSENNDRIRTSRLDHVSRVKNVYDFLNTSSQLTSLPLDPNLHPSTKELTTLFDYVVHILPEEELGYFSNGTGCLSSSNIDQQRHQLSRSTSIRFKYPLDANDEPTLKYFCFPDQHDSNNNPLSCIKRTKQEYFRFTLTNMHGVRQYGYCSRFFHKGILNALCVVSPYDVIEIYEKILSTATQLFISYKDDDARTFLKEIYHHRLPNRNDTIYISTTTVGLYTLKCEYDRRKLLIDSVTLLGLSTDTIIKIFSSILYEQKLIFIGNELGPLTRLINTFICLLYPFSWPHTYVPILPALMLDIVQAPTPYIIGILRSCESYLSANDDLLSQDNSDILIIDIDHDRIRSIGDYLTNNLHRGSMENLHAFSTSHSETTRFQILPKIFKIELKQEISLLRKTRSSLSLDECQQRLRDVFMSIFVQSCYNYKDYHNGGFQREEFLQSKQHTIELFLEWFTRTQIFELFIRQKFESSNANQFAVSFDIACENYARTLHKQTPQRITAKSVKRKSATRANKQENRF